MSASLLDDLLERFDAMTDADKQAVISAANESAGDATWLPLPGPQMEAYLCEADELFYGGCVSADTEFLTENGWKRIDEYKSGDNVAQWHENNERISFVDPDGYTDAPCKELIHFKHKRLSMVLSEYHRMPLYNYRGEFVVKYAHEIEWQPSKYKVPVNFNVFRSGLDMSDDLLRMGVAIHADGNLSPRKKDNGAHCRVSLRKDRKKKRLISLMKSLNIEWSEYRNPNRPTEVRYGFNSPILTKHFDDKWWNASQRQLEIILEEMSFWDGNISGTKGGDICFNTTSKNDADFIQYTAHACNRVASISAYPKLPFHHATLYKVHISHEGSIKSSVTLRKDAIKIERVKTDRMYCFTVPTSFWLARNHGKVFVTGNSAGGGKSELGLGLALTKHNRSLFLRREREVVKDAFDRVEEILGHSNGRNGSDLVWKFGDNQIKFGGCKDEKDKQKYKGRPRDLFVFDEISDFLKSQFMFIKTWNRSADSSQRCRVLCTGNPPTTAEGLWVIEYWAAWLDPKHPNPAKDGEIRWYTNNKYGEEVEVDGRGPHTFEYEDSTTETVLARSRTFIRARLSDNVYFDDTDYAANLDALDPALRLAYRDGRFDLALEDNPRQLIPTQWILDAQARWRSMNNGRPPDHVPMCAIGVDIAQGGNDETVLAARHDGWFAPLKIVPGKDTPNGASVLALIVQLRRDQAIPILDMGGGFGGATAEKCDENGIKYAKYKGAAESTGRSRCKTFTFVNKRTESYYRFKEALDPEQPGGSDICLPDDPRLVADLTAPLYDVKRGRGGSMVLKITTKDDLIKLLGRSPDRADAVIMAWTDGAKADTAAQIWHSKSNGIPQVKMGYSQRRRRR